MRTRLPEILCATGTAILVGGLMTFIYGYSILGTVWGVHIGNLFLDGHGLCAAGGILAVVGSGVAVFGILLLRHRDH